MAGITLERYAVTFPYCAYQSNQKGQHTGTPTTLMSTCALHGMHSKCRCVHTHQQLIEATMHAAGRYPLGRCGKSIGQPSWKTHGWGTRIVSTQSKLDHCCSNMRSDQLVTCVYQSRDTLWRQLTTAHAIVAAQYRKLRRVERDTQLADDNRTAEIIVAQESYTGAYAHVRHHHTLLDSTTHTTDCPISSASPFACSN